MNEQLRNPSELTMAFVERSGEPAIEQLSDERQPISTFRRLVYLGAAGFFFLLGAAGAILPGLPATPFLLLTSYFLVRTSPRLNDQLLRTQLFGPILRDWQQRGGVRPNVKLKAVAVIAIAVGLTTILSTFPTILRLVVVILAAVGVVVVLRLPTVRDC